MLKEIGRLQRLANFAAGDKVVHTCFRSHMVSCPPCEDPKIRPEELEVLPLPLFIHLGFLNKSCGGADPIHLGLSIVSIVFFTRLPNKAKKFSSSGSGSSRGLAVRVGAVLLGCISAWPAGR